MDNTREDRRQLIEKIVMNTIFEVTNESFFGVKASKLLTLRSDIDKKRKQFDESPQVAEKLQKVSNCLVEAERLLGELLPYDQQENGYIPMTKK